MRIDRMLKRILAILVFTFFFCLSCVDHSARLMDGDIIFQDLRSSQSTAVKLATGSRYSHTGILILNDVRDKNKSL